MKREGAGFNVYVSMVIAFMLLTASFAGLCPGVPGDGPAQAGNFSAIINGSGTGGDVPSGLADAVANVSADRPLSATLDGRAGDSPAFDNGTAGAANEMKIGLSDSEYAPGGSMSMAVTSTGGMPLVTVTSPDGDQAAVPLIDAGNHTFTGVYSLGGSVTLGNYTVTASAGSNDTQAFSTAYFNVTMAGDENNVITSMTPPSTIKAWANVSDPFGAYDINYVNATLYYPNGTQYLGPTTMSRTSSGTAWASYTCNFSIPSGIDGSNYSAVIWATETNGIRVSNSSMLYVYGPPNVGVNKRSYT